MTDPHSYANFDQVVVTHYSLNLHTDFNRKIFYGHVDVRAKVVDEFAKCLCLDIKALAIERITFNDAEIQWTIPKTNNLGSLLSIPIPEKHHSDSEEDN